MFTNQYIYREKGRAKPAVESFEERKDNNEIQNVAAELRRILLLLIEPSDENNEVAFFMDNVAKSFAEMFVGTIIGPGVGISVKGNKQAEEKIRDWNDAININGDNIERFMNDFIIDNLIYNRSYWRIARNVRGIDNEIKPGIDVQRMDPKRIEKFRDKERGIMKFVQTVPQHPTYSTVNQFLKDYENMGFNSSYNEHFKITIPDDQRLIMHGNLFTRPPMDTALPYIILKYWLMTFMKKYADKSWAGILLAYIGDPKTSYYPSDPMDMQDAINKTTASLVKLRNFGAATFPGDTRVDQIEPPQQGKIYSEWFDKMNREIMYSFYSSINTRESNSTFRGNEVADETTVRFMKVVRRRVEHILRRFYVMNVVPGVKPRDIIFTWSEIRTTSVESIATAFEKFVTYGVFVDANERRRAASLVFEFLAENHLTDEQVKKLDKDMKDLNEPSRAEGADNSQNSTKGNSASRKAGSKSK
jgi:hypothetical protein